MTNHHKQSDAELMKNAWDSYHPIYMECILKNRPDFYAFYSGGKVDDDFEFGLLGEVQGLKLLDTCCACDASQAVLLDQSGCCGHCL